jgi:xanthine dehydrogenase accessory factor
MQIATEPWSATTPEIFKRIGRAIGADRSLAIATVIGVDGAAYRRPGAKAVIGPTIHMAG